MGKDNIRSSCKSVLHILKSHVKSTLALDTTSSQILELIDIHERRSLHDMCLDVAYVSQSHKTLSRLDAGDFVGKQCSSGGFGSRCCYARSNLQSGFMERRPE